MNKRTQKIAVLGAGLAGCCAALHAANLGYEVALYDKNFLPLKSASLHNEGKLHLGYVYGADPQAQTHDVMIKGSLSFIDNIRQLTRLDARELCKSKPFVYGVPNDSQLTLEQQIAHFKKVDEHVQKELSSNNKNYDRHYFEESYSQTEEEMNRTFNSDRIAGSIQTSEYSVDTQEIANIVRAAVLSNPLISVNMNTCINGAHQAVDMSFQLEFDDGKRSAAHYHGVINCLWEDRIRIDKSIGITPDRAWLVRYKAAISGRLTTAKEVPSATLVTGAYGDIVNHGDGRFYLSWYPSCKLGESSDDNYAEIEARVKRINPKSLVKESIESLSAYIPSVKSALKYDKFIQVNGGYIFAWGKSDITDPVSGLHQRHLIGPSACDNWVSVNTGKYCTAPMFGIQASQLLHKQLI